METILVVNVLFPFNADIGFNFPTVVNESEWFSVLTWLDVYVVGHNAGTCCIAEACKITCPLERKIDEKEHLKGYL